MRSSLLLACLVLCCAAAPAGAWTVQANPEGATGDQHIDYPSWSATDNSAPWLTAANVGDVDGDGREDIAAAFGYAEPGGVTPIYVTFSSAQASSGSVAQHGGFKIVSKSYVYGMSAAGDVNGDGRGDIAIATIEDVRVVFGRTDHATVDLRELGDDGFSIEGVGVGGGSGGNGAMISTGTAPLGDVNADGVPDLLVASYGSAAIVYPPRDAAGTTIDASAAGPRVATIGTDDAHRISSSIVDVLGDVDGDGRADVLLAGEEYGTDQAVYGISSPAPGETVTLPAAVAAGKAFSIRTHDGRAGWWGELEDVRTLTDQNGDGIRDVSLVCGGCGSGGRQLRVVYTPRLGTAIDAGDLYASDPRGWSFHSYSSVTDVGDQSGDGVGDVATSSYVYFPDPRHEPGSNEPVHSGLYWSGGEQIVASLADVNGDGRREIVVADVDFTDLNGHSAADGQSATYAIDVYDSAVAPDVSLPDAPVPAPDGQLAVGVTIDPGDGSRGGRSLVMSPTLEVATPTGAPQVATESGAVSGTHAVKLAIKPGRALGGLVAGERYRVRAAAINSRGREAAGPWRSFTYAPAGSAGAAPARTLRLGVATKTLRLRKGRLGVSVYCGYGSGRCRGTLTLKAGKLRLGSRRFAIAAGHRATVAVTVGKTARRALRTRRSVRVTATAKATSAKGLAGSTTSRFTARLR